MNTDLETVLSTLLSHLQSSATISFTGSGTANSAVLSVASVPSSLFSGLPVFGPGVSRGTTILSTDAGAGTITLSDPVTADSTDANFTTGFLTTGRRVKYWTEVAEQPALFIRHGPEDDDEWHNGRNAITTVNAEIWIYSRAGEDPDVAPDIGLNNLVRCVRNSFAPDDSATGRFTLGGLVFWCRIEGRSSYDPGDLDAQGKAVLPVKITLP